MEKKLKRELIRILCAAVLFAAAILLPLQGALRFALFMVPYLFVGWDVLYSAGRNILRGQVFDENFLMSLATVGALAIGEYPEAVVVMLFYQIGSLFEHYAVGKSRKSIAALMDIRPDSANLEQDGGVVRVDPEEVQVGMVIVVRPGEKIPLDGIVLEGDSSLNTTALTGESMPRDVHAGDAVISGCVNMTGLMRVRVTKEFGESTASKILELVESSSMNKARSEDFITRFAKIYTPAVVIAAVCLALLPPIFTGGNFAQWLHRALIFLVVSCPCALVISVPLSFFGGIGGASRQGILVKGSNYLEALAKADTMVFDKTGTLTKGTFSVVEVMPNAASKQELLDVAAHAECFSTHPIAASLRRAAGSVDERRVRDVREISGMGICATVDGKPAFVGNRRHMESAGISASACPEPSRPGTVIHVCFDKKYLGYIVISDTIKEGAKDVLSALRQQGVRSLVMLTGDADRAGRYVANQLGMDDVHAELLPVGKVQVVERLLLQDERKGTLAFVGDGINDAPVLSRADVGIAMGALGSDAAIEAADVVLMDDRLSKLPVAIRVARKTLSIVRQNIVFALFVKALVLVLGAMGIAGMWEAVFADVGVSVLAILNAMRAMRQK
ncbi:MAG: heavy metal translocating P-type ATPase [Eubacteriales bacterium]|nr:heavy metal translocating P-type ATPase [Eubacteriales bacterium]